MSETISHFRIIKQLGKGGMGVVYLAEDITLGRKVMVKVLSTPTKKHRARFLHEAKTVSSLTHPNIPSVFECGETMEGQPYIVMEFVGGDSLENKLREGLLPLREAISFVLGIAAALGEAHRMGIVHRDVKPSNVLITERGQVKLIDFGIATRSSNQTKVRKIPDLGIVSNIDTMSDLFVGTARYASPEQVTGEMVSKASDLFALGIICYECITGKTPFPGESWAEIRHLILHFDPPVPSRINPLVPPELDGITMKAIAKKPEGRYYSADRFIEALQLVLPLLGTQSERETNSDVLQNLESEFDCLLLQMQTGKSRSAVKSAFESSTAQLGRTAVRHARKQR